MIIRTIESDVSAIVSSLKLNYQNKSNTVYAIREWGQERHMNNESYSSIFDENFKRGSKRLLPILTAIIGDN